MENPKEEPRKIDTCRNWDMEIGCVQTDCRCEKEKPKQENCCTPIGQIKRYVDCKGCDRKTKQETVEEAALNYLLKQSKIGEDVYVGDFREGANWQAKQMYSEEEVKFIERLIGFYWVENNSEHPNNLEEWELSKKIINQFKKK